MMPIGSFTGTFSTMEPLRFGAIVTTITPFPSAFISISFTQKLLSWVFPVMSVIVRCIGYSAKRKKVEYWRRAMSVQIYLSFDFL